MSSAQGRIGSDGPARRAREFIAEDDSKKENLINSQGGDKGRC